MYLERLLQINMATLAALGALLLGMGQRGVGPPLLVAAAAAASIWLTDVTGWFRLGRRAANLLMLVAAAVSLRELYPLGSELQTLGFARLLIYLQIILLFQRKDARIYWLLIMLSLLQVVVATLFSQGVWFGLLLAVYMLLGFSAMTLLLQYRQWERHRPGSEKPKIGVSGLKSRWPAAANPTGFDSLPGGGSHAGIGSDLFRRLGRMGVHTLALTLVLFFAVPRFGQLAWRGPVVHPQSLVGFSDTVELGELGQIIESRDEVMRVRFRGYPDDAPQPVHGEIYLRGAVMMTYERGRWLAGAATSELGIESLVRARPRPQLGITRQNITIEGLNRNELFYVAPYVALESNPSITIDCPRQRLLRADYLRSRRFEYSLGTTAIVGEKQSPLAPSSQSDLRHNVALAMPPGENRGGLPNLAKLAERWVAESGLPEEDRIGRARYLEGQFAASGRFQYSLTGQARDTTIDPIEDFVTQHPRGHCEYFATALTLMLRSQGIPARMVSGYKCDEWNELGSYYQVRQLHAHAWVEAYLEPRQIPPELIHGDKYWPWSKEGGWLRLDPTPGGTVGQRDTWFTPLRRGMDWMNSAWSNYVVELDCTRQRDAIYQPIANAVKSLWQAVTEPSRWRALLNSAAVALYLDHLGREAKWGLLVIVALVLATALAGIGWLLWRLGRRLRSRWTGDGSRRVGRRRSEIDFYRRFEALLARRGLVRTHAQTQREFAAEAGRRLAAMTEDGRLESLPEIVAEAYYRVRFGQTPLDSLQVQTVEQALGEIASLQKIAGDSGRLSRMQGPLS